MFQESFYMFKTLKKSMWIGGFSISKVLFLYQMFVKSFQFYCELYIFHKKGFMCSKFSKNKNTYTFLDFDIQTSLSIIIVLNL